MTEETRPPNLEDQSLLGLLEGDPRAAQEIAAAELADFVNWALRQALKNANLQQKELAKKLGVTEGAVSQVLGGDGNVKISTLAKYARALGYRVKVGLAPLADGLAPISVPERRRFRPLSPQVRLPIQATGNPVSILSRESMRLETTLRSATYPIRQSGVSSMRPYDPRESLTEESTEGRARA